jgi:hypothetical protein
MPGLRRVSGKWGIISSISSILEKSSCFDFKPGVYWKGKS